MFLQRNRFDMNGLVLWIPMNEGSGTTAYDKTKNHLNATITDVTYSAGKFGNGLTFNGSSAYLSIADNNLLDFVTTFTMAFWIYPTTNHTSYNRIIDKVYTSYGVYFVNASTEDLCLFINGGSLIATSDQPVTVNAWNFIVIDYLKGETANIYVNNVHKATGSATADIVVNANALEIGRQNGSALEFYTGIMDNIMFFNRVLSPRERIALMNGWKPENRIIKYEKKTKLSRTVR